MTDVAVLHAPTPDDPGAPPPAPSTAATRGRGRWLAHHLADVEERWLAGGFEVRVRAASSGGATGTEG